PASASGRSNRRPCANCAIRRGRRNCGPSSIPRSNSPIAVRGWQLGQLRTAAKRTANRELQLAMLAALLLASAAALPYHIELQANPGAPFPFLSRFGTVTLHVYNGGVRADTMWLNGFSRNGSNTVTVENPL